MENWATGRNSYKSRGCGDGALIFRTDKSYYLVYKLYEQHSTPTIRIMSVETA